MRQKTSLSYFLKIIIVSSLFFHFGLIAQTTITIGTQLTQSGTTGASPYNYSWEASRVQFVYTKAEIEAAGGSSGIISSIAWDVSEVNGGNLLNYQIRMAYTSATDASSHNTATLSTVKTAHTLTPGSTGWRTISFDNPFMWNGTDNLLVDVCFGVNSGYAYSGQIYMYNNISNQTRSIRSINESRCAANTNVSRNYKPRVQMTFTECNPPQASILKTCSHDYTSYDLDIEITNLGDATGVDISDGTTTLFSNVGLGTYQISNINTAKTIIFADHDNTNCKSAQAFDLCDVCLSPSLPTDECANAPLIDLSQAFAGSTNCSYTASAGSPSGCGTIENDSWIKFIAADTEVEMEFTVGDCYTSGGTRAYDGIQLSVFSGSCGTLSILSGSCVNPISTGQNANSTGTWNFSGLTIGATYYIRIDGYAGQLCGYYFEPIQGVVITPDNDLCSDAIELNCGNSLIASNILATATDAPSGCSGGGTPGKGVWYKFIGTGQNVTISTDNSGTNFDTQINVYSGSCGSLVCIGGDDDSGNGTTSTITFLSVLGTTYHIYVDGDGAAEGQFEISLSCVANDNYYWVGGAGNWSNNATRWATTSGGSIFHPTIPSETANVFFDANSGSGVVDINIPTSVANLYIHNFSGSFSGSNHLNCIDLNLTSGTMAINSSSINVSGNATILGTVSISTGSLDVNGTYDANGGNTTFTNHGFLKLGGSSVISMGSLTNNLGTVVYDRAGTQTILANTYHNLEIAGSGTKYLGGNIILNGSISLSSGTLNATDSNYDISVNGHWNNAGGLFNPQQGTVTFGGNSIQHINTSDAGTIVNSQNFSLYNVVIDGNDVRLHVDETNFRKLNINNITINNGKTLRQIKH